MFVALFVSVVCDDLIGYRIYLAVSFNVGRGWTAMTRRDPPILSARSFAFATSSAATGAYGCPVANYATTEECGDEEMSCVSSPGMLRALEARLLKWLK